VEARREFLMGLRVGDVVRLNGKLRVIRKAGEPRVARGDYPPKRSFWFTPLRCSWTRRPYIIRTSTDLLSASVSISLVLRNYQPKTESEHRLQEVLDAWPRDMRDAMHCCDVKGIG